eukprot:CAMPEP_0119128136 /NCGR_PEP_ID=MMETSP1310-20130426/6404_1 /TAXON_ID=464262 /ORGANISM="Genus nov. species nov., Strain RCC2339" /LENGTH=703 /DNA_ID=CAMNT_0007118445 /DNA_START=134 /DNA_END=2241 /DNA_ORIENTATION=-
MELDLGTKEIPRSAVAPRFLHSNSSSHSWAFGAIAELIDNARDPDVGAKNFYIGVEDCSFGAALTFLDDGNGASPEVLHKMLSFGYCDKDQYVDGPLPIGHYGNGFKSGSMRLGKDALVFSKALGSSGGVATHSVGMLSQTYLDAIQSSEVLCPMVSWAEAAMGETPAGGVASLAVILEHSPFKSMREVKRMFSRIRRSGTLIVVYNLRMEGPQPELDFSQKDDIRIRRFSGEDPGTQAVDFKKRPQRAGVAKKDSMPLEFSLREYCTVLYLEPRMKIIIRGIKVQHRLVEHSLSRTSFDYYTPRSANQEDADRVRITFGKSTSKDSQSYGMLIYHRGRLIQPYLRVGVQLSGMNPEAVGVVGIVDANFLQPTHNKQDFQRTKAYQLCIAALESRLKTYCSLLLGNESFQGNDDETTLPDVLWAQCDSCLKWRRLPDSVAKNSLPKKWYCYMNPVSKYSICTAEEESYEIEPMESLSTVRNRQRREEREKKARDVRLEEERAKRMRANSQLAKVKLEVAERLAEQGGASSGKRKRHPGEGTTPDAKRPRTVEVPAGSDHSGKGKVPSVQPKRSVGGGEEVEMAGITARELRRMMKKVAKVVASAWKLDKEWIAPLRKVEFWQQLKVDDLIREQEEIMAKELDEKDKLLAEADAKVKGLQEMLKRKEGAESETPHVATGGSQGTEPVRKQIQSLYMSLVLMEST